MYMMEWMIAMIVLICIEIATVGLTTIWFAIGALAAIIASALGAGIYLQITVFLVVSLVMVIFTRPIAVKYINSSRTRTNYEADIGKVVRITEDISNIEQKGSAVLDGQEWTARSADETEMIKEGELARVVAIKGVKLIVKRIDENEANQPNEKEI